MKETDLAWLAGLLEGEGCFTFKITRGVRDVNISARIQLKMTDFDVVERAADLLESQPPITYTKPTVRGKPIYEIGISGAKAVHMMTRLLPYMGFRRTEKILSGMADWYELQFRRCVRCETEFCIQGNGSRVFCSERCNKKKWNDIATEKRRAALCLNQ